MEKKKGERKKKKRKERNLMRKKKAEIKKTRHHKTKGTFGDYRFSAEGNLTPTTPPWSQDEYHRIRKEETKSRRNESPQHPLPRCNRSPRTQTVDLSNLCCLFSESAENQLTRNSPTAVISETVVYRLFWLAAFNFPSAPSASWEMDESITESRAKKKVLF